MPRSIHNEDSRVKVPALVHLTKLGYQYLSLREIEHDPNTNIIPSVFIEAFLRFNTSLNRSDAERELKELKALLDNNDLGRSAYRRLTDTSKPRLIDLNNFHNNTLQCVTEFTCQNGDDSFRPDITLLVNGLPLAFIEVKIPNNRNGILAERDRMDKRFQNPKFRKFINITQLMVFSNNSEYDDGSPEPLDGAYYTSTAMRKATMNYFREELPEELTGSLKDISRTAEDYILKDNNFPTLKATPEYQTNISPTTPTNRILTSLFTPDRFGFLLKYGITYVEDKENHAYEKHVMRYPQLFASKAITRALDDGEKGGIIWHTQGSGKTALAYYNVAYLRDYFTRKQIVPKFYFIVDRISLLDQATKEFKKRGLRVHEVKDKNAFMHDIKSNVAVHNTEGKSEITVVNIQRFDDDKSLTKNTDYAINLQRIYFMDEVHRSYNPEGSFLANLKESDPNAIRIGLTGTPLLTRKLTTKKGEPPRTYDSKLLFGNYIHRYYYDSSIKDGYTLRLIREDIQTEYKADLQELIDELEVQQGSGNIKDVYAHEKFVIPMLEYIMTDVEQSRIRFGDDSIGAMVICDSSDQAREMANRFELSYGELTHPDTIATKLMAAEEPTEYNVSSIKKRTATNASLILHDFGSKEDRENWVAQFKKGEIDILFVYNMLLTGFDAPRLKKLYLGRVIKAHNLLQALTRVNRTYKNFRHGYVVDFANIKTEFKKANQAYLKELTEELGDEVKHYENLFKSETETRADIEHIKDVLYKYDHENLEVYSQQVREITQTEDVRELVKALNTAKSLYNLIRLSGKDELLDTLDFRRLHSMAGEADRHLAMLNTKQALEESTESSELLNLALEEIFFTFRKTEEHEIQIADQLQTSMRRTRETLGGNFAPKDPEFITLREEIERLFKNKNIAEVTMEEMGDNIEVLDALYKKAKDLERRNNLTRAMYNQDIKFTRIHKRLMEKKDPTENERKLCEALMAVKERTDSLLLASSQLLTQEAYAKQEFQKVIIQEMKGTHNLPLNRANTNFINDLLIKEYRAEFSGMESA